MDGITNSMDMNLSELQEIVKDREALHAASMGSQRVGHNLATEQQQAGHPSSDNCFPKCGEKVLTPQKPPAHQRRVSLRMFRMGERKIPFY